MNVVAVFMNWKRACKLITLGGCDGSDVKRHEERVMEKLKVREFVCDPPIQFLSSAAAEEHSLVRPTTTTTSSVFFGKIKISSRTCHPHFYLLSVPVVNSFCTLYIVPCKLFMLTYNVQCTW